MKIGILGSGNVAAALGAGWVGAGHEVVIGGRDPEKSDALAQRIGARSAPPATAVEGADAVLLAVLWAGVPELLTLAGAGRGSLAGTVLIDPTNAVEHGVGLLTVEGAPSAAERIAGLAPGSRVVKAFHLFPADLWVSGGGRGPDGRPVTVALCGADEEAIEVTGRLVRDLVGEPASLGSHDSARQLEEVAGFVIGLAFGGFDPQSALPQVERR